MPRKEAHLRREPGSERRAERWRKVSGERPAQHPSRNGIRLPRIAARLRARLHPSRDELLRLADAALIGLPGSEQRQGDQLRVILPFVPPELGHSRTGPVAPIAREREVLDLACAPEIGDTAQRACVHAAEVDRRGHREARALFKPGAQRRAHAVEPEARLMDDPPGQLRRPKMAGSPHEATEGGGHDPTDTGSPVASESTAANVASVTAASVSTGMGAGPPVRTASMNAATQARWPLSWASFRDLRTRPLRRRVSVRKSSRTAEAPSPRTSRRSLPAVKSPVAT